GYERWSELLTDFHLGGNTPRERRISLGLREGLWESIASPFSLLEWRDGAAVAEPVTGRHPGRLPWREKTVVTEPSRFRRKSVMSDSRSVPVKLGGSGKPKITVLSGDGAAPGQRDAGAGTARMAIPDMLEAQGFPRDMLDNCPLTSDGKRKAIGNGVPYAMGVVLARLVRRLVEAESWEAQDG
ncbi:MAG: hypothetical protein ACOC9T_00215, partial [Myxococcota bacterium]